RGWSSRATTRPWTSSWSSGSPWTRGCVSRSARAAARSAPASSRKSASRKGREAPVPQSKIRIRLKGYDHQQLDKSASQIVETAQRTGATITGPVPLPTEKNVYCVIRSPFKDKDSREHFEVRTHKRLIDIHS